MTKTHVPNAQAKTVGQAHKSGAAPKAQAQRRDKKRVLNRDAPRSDDETRTGSHRPDAPKVDVPPPQAAKGDDDLMSQPQPFPPIVTPAND